MIKRFYLALAILAGLLSPAHSAGTIPWSLSQQFDALGKPLAGCKLYIYAAGTTTPQSAYQDTALTNTWPNPLICDSAGRLPQFFLADGLVKIRITDKNGVPQAYAGQGQIDNVLVIGPSSGGGGGGGSIDPTTILQTGDIKSRYGTGIHTGWVRLNGRTIGSATSGATERANADAQALFEYLWSTDPNLTVSTGRGASANADWVANKTITLPDGRGRVLAALDDMGNTAAGRLTGAYFGACTGGAGGLNLGNVGGCESWTLTQAQMPIVSPTFTGINDPVNVTTTGGVWVGNSAFTAGTGGPQTLPAGPQGQSSTGTFTPRGSISSFGSGAAHPIVQPTLLITNYIKL